MSGWECKILTRPRCGRMRSQPGNTLSLAAAAKVKVVTWALRLKAREGGDCLGWILVRATLRPPMRWKNTCCTDVCQSILKICVRAV